MTKSHTKNLKEEEKGNKTMALQVIIFCLLLLVCPYANGTRDIGTENLEISSEPFVTNYGARKIVKELEVSDREPYMANYGGRKIVKEVEISEPYMTNYGARKSEETVVVKEPYVTNYGARKSVEAVEVREPYMTNYGESTVKEVEVIEPYMLNYKATEGGQEAEEPYVTNCGAKKSMKEVVKTEPYMTNYGAKTTEKEMEVREPYMTNYGATESEQVEKPYMTNYGSKEDIKETEASYMTQYGTKQGETRVEKTVPSAHHEHQHHMHAHSSSRNEAHEQGFFTLVDFHKGCTMPLNFPNQNHSPFLPRETADSLPFSTSQLPQLLQLFSIPRDSGEARHVAYTLDQCEQTPIKGETKFCATSLESMNDFVHKIIGSGIKLSILSTTHPSTSTSITQKYTILQKPKRVIASKMVFCHPVPYPYAVFFCHHFETDIRFFQVSLGGENGDTVEAVAVCHMDTSDWDSNLSLFRDLGIKAGASSPVCHFLPENHLAWVPSPVTATA